MNKTAVAPSPQIVSEQDTVTALYRAWKAAEGARTTLVMRGEAFTVEQWEGLLADIEVTRDAYYLALNSAVANRDPALQRLLDLIDAASQELTSMVDRRRSIIDLLSLVDRLAGMAGKLLATAIV